MKRAAIILSLLAPLTIFLNNELNPETFFDASLGYSVAIGIFILLKLITSNNLYSYIAVVIFASWINQISNTVFLLIIAIQIFAMILLEIFHFQKNKLLLFLAGFISTYIFPLGQGFANSAILSSFTFMIFRKKMNSFTIPYFYILGFCWGVIILSIILILSSSLKNFLQLQWSILANFGDFQNFNASLSVIFTSVVLTIAITLLIYRKRFGYVYIILLLIFDLAVTLQNNSMDILPISIISLSGIPIAIISRFNGFMNLKPLIMVTSLVLVLFGLVIEF